MIYQSSRGLQDSPEWQASDGLVPFSGDVLLAFELLAHGLYDAAHGSCSCAHTSTATIAFCLQDAHNVNPVCGALDQCQRAGSWLCIRRTAGAGCATNAQPAQRLQSQGRLKYCVHALTSFGVMDAGVSTTHARIDTHRSRPHDPHGMGLSWRRLNQNTLHGRLTASHMQHGFQTALPAGQAAPVPYQPADDSMQGCRRSAAVAPASQRLPPAGACWRRCTRCRPQVPGNGLRACRRRSSCGGFRLSNPSVLLTQGQGVQTSERCNMHGILSPPCILVLAYATAMAAVSTPPCACCGKAAAYTDTATCPRQPHPATQDLIRCKRCVSNV